jgi:hypothetical protein
MSVGESGRPRADNDAYATPRENVTAFPIGLCRMGIALPQALYDPCGGSGQLARVLMVLEPGVRVSIADINPEFLDSDLSVPCGPLDATRRGDIMRGLDASGARGIVSNPPYSKKLNPFIVENCLALLRAREIDFVALMQKTNHALDSDIGYRETAAEPLFVGAVACVWRTILFVGSKKTPKYAHSWLIWTAAGRGDRKPFQVAAIHRGETAVVLKERAR